MTERKWIPAKEDLPYDSEMEYTPCLVAWRPSTMSEDECRKLSSNHGPHFFGIVDWLNTSDYTGWDTEMLQELMSGFVEDTEAEIIAWQELNYFEEVK